MSLVPEPFYRNPHRHLAEFVLVPPDGRTVGIATIGNYTHATALAEKYGSTEAGYRDAERRRVDIHTPFHIMRYPVTNALFFEFTRARQSEDRPYLTTAEQIGAAWALDGERWRSVPGACWGHPTPQGHSASQRPTAPVTCVTWYDANAFAHWLTEMTTPTGQRSPRSPIYRLPTENEWEFACRAGSSDTAFWWGNELDDEHAIHRCGQYADRAGPESVEESPASGSGRCNPWGLCDMLGNVWEWCDNRYSLKQPRYVVVRGGSWGSSSCPGRMLCSFRGRLKPDERGDRNGFRLVFAPPEGLDEGAIRVTCMISGESEAGFVVSQVRLGEIAIGEKGFLPG